jgi:hypothetical protein
MTGRGNQPEIAVTSSLPNSDHDMFRNVVGLTFKFFFSDGAQDTVLTGHSIFPERV